MRFVIAALIVSLAGVVVPQDMRAAQAADRPVFDAVAIKPCDNNLPPNFRGGPGNISPGHMTLNCQSAKGLIAEAYLIYAGGKTHPAYVASTSGTVIVGGPSWIRSDRYTVSASAAGAPSGPMMQGPMLQRVLEERFHLTMHTETRELDVYELRVARGGPKLRPFTPGRCVVLDLGREEGLPKLEPEQKLCVSFADVANGHVVMDWEGVTIDEFTNALLNGPFADRRILDRTGLTGRYDIHFEVAASTGEPAAAPARRSSPPCRSSSA